MDNSKTNELMDKLNKSTTEIKKVITGQDDVVNQTITGILSGGHILLMGVPGLAKTLLVTTISKALGLANNRIQCTPDLMPSDVTGSEVLEENEKGKRSFRFIKGPIFTELLMADEINRASPRTQSSLLQAMQEKQVTIAGKSYDLPEPFHVLATQNPLEQEGTYPLPEAQLDRFMMQINIDYPSYDDERQLVLATTSNENYQVKEIVNKTDIIELQKIVRDMPIGETVLDYCIKIIRNARPSDESSDLINEYVNWAPGTRASQALVMTSRAKALIDNRTAPSIDDVRVLVLPVLRHRMSLNYKANADGITIQDIVQEICK